MKLGAIAAVLWSIVIAIIVIVFVATQYTSVNQYLTDLDNQTGSSPAQQLQPYGGCDEAWQAPDSPGAEWCRNHGYLVDQ